MNTKELDVQEHDRLKELLVDLFASYGKADEHTQMMAYYKHLKGYPLEILEKAIELAIQTYSYSVVPTVGEIFKKMIEANEMLHPELCLPAWVDVQAEILNAQRNVPYNKVPKWSSPFVAEVVSSFGWYTIATIESDKQNVMLGQMRKVYDSLCERIRVSRLRELNKALLGIGGESVQKPALLSSERGSGLTVIGDIVPNIVA